MIEKIKKLKQKHNAIILAHNYQRPEVQDLADITGDSLELSRRAATSDAAVIVFCGVYFMAETAALLAPDKTILIPDKNAGCPMANMATAREVRDWKTAHPEAVIVAYVNSSAAVKAEVDICCTSANAVKVVESIPVEKTILFLPDKSLGGWVARQTGRKLQLWPGYCPTHHRIMAVDIAAQRATHPEALVLAHPECLAEVVDVADAVLSTSGMLRYARENKAQEFIVATEIGLLHTLRQQNPVKSFYAATQLGDCPNMKLTTVEKVLWALEDMEYKVTIPAETAVRARQAVEKMIAIG